MPFSKTLVAFSDPPVIRLLSLSPEHFTVLHLYMNIPNYITTAHWACVKHRTTSQHHTGRVRNPKLYHNITLDFNISD